MKGLLDDPQIAGVAPIKQLVKRALNDIESIGGILVDIEIPDLNHYIELTSLYVTRSKYDINNFFSYTLSADKNSRRNISK